MISNTTSKVVYQGDGKTTEFPYTFDLAAKSDMHVSLYDIETEIATELTSDFYVDMTAGKVIYPGYESGQEPEETERPAILSSTQKLTLYRETDINQLTSLGSKYPLPNIETMSDKLTMICQELSETLTRCITSDVGSDKGPSEILADISEARSTCVASASAASTSETNAKASEEAAVKSELSALASQTKAEEILADIEASAAAAGGIATVYSASKTYKPADQVMLPDGTVYRCIATSTGEDPATSGKWVQSAIATKGTFIRDSENDLMPLEYAQADSLYSIDDDDDIYPVAIT